MTGPEHYREGEERMHASDWQWQEAHTDTDIAGALHEAVMATAHFLAALTAAVATSQHPDSIAWQQAINPQEQT